MCIRDSLLSCLLCGRSFEWYLDPELELVVAHLPKARHLQKGWGCRSFTIAPVGRETPCSCKSSMQDVHSWLEFQPLVQS
eukprot:5099597-Alexandrium_andersonii.AAC.1